MADESKILSSEEMDALLSVTQNKATDLTELIGVDHSDDKWLSGTAVLNPKALRNLIELVWSECEKLFTSFLRKKVVVHATDAHLTRFADALKIHTERHVYTTFRLMPGGHFALVIVNMPLLHQAINYIFGGQVNDQDTVIQSPGKVGVIISERICQLAMEAFALAGKEYGAVTFEVIKTVTLPNLITKFSPEDRVYTVELSVFFGDLETSLTLIFMANFLSEFIPANVEDLALQAEKHSSWRSAIETQVVDSYVTVNASLPDVTIKAMDLLNLKVGDLIPITDPTSVFVCLNNTKLFSGSAGQANSTRVVKILNEM